MASGSLYERHGKYYAMISFTENGKRKQKSKSTGLTIKGNKRNAEEVLDDYITEYKLLEEKGNSTSSDLPLFVDFMKSWLEITKNSLEKTTMNSYTSMFTARIQPFFGKLNLKLNEVESKHIREFHESIFLDGCKANTVVRYHALVRKCLQYALKNELIHKNVADAVDRPKVDKYVTSYYNEKELTTLFKACTSDSLWLVIPLAAYYGLRRSEVLGIRWSSIDFDRKTVTINHKVTEHRKDGESFVLAEDKLKNKSSFRTLPLIPVVEQLLFEAKEKQANYRRLFGKDYCKEYLDYVCVDELGVLIRPTYVTDHFGTFLKQHKLKKIRFHDLRHSCASLLLANKVPMKAIQEWLGHSTFATTADTYSHLDFQSKIASANVIADLFSGSEVAVL